MTEEQIRELLREMRDEPVPPGSLARVRLGALERTQRPRVPWRMLLAALAAACCLVLVFRPKAAIEAPREPRAVAAVRPQPTPALLEVSVPAASPAHRPPRAKARRPRPAPPSFVRQDEGQPVEIRIETPDPDVVIVLLGS